MALLVTPAACAAYAGLPATASEELAIFERLEAAAVRLLERLTGRAYALYEGRAELYCTSGGESLILDNAYRSAPTVSYRSTIGGDWTAYTSDEVEVYGRRAYAVNGWPDTSFPAVLVVGDVGYAAPLDTEEESADAPADLLISVKSLVADMFRTRSLAVDSADQAGTVAARDIRDSVRMFVASQKITVRGLHAPEFEA